MGKPAFVGSKMPGHRDVPELRWWRPRSEEARKDVPRNLLLLEGWRRS